MKKVKSARRSPTAKIKATPTTVKEYLAAVPEPARTTLKKVREAIRSAAPPGAAEIISYKIPAFKYKQVVIWYAAFRDHCSLFPSAAVIAALKHELRAYSTSKGTVQFPIDKPIPAALIRKMVKARVEHIESKTRR